MGLLGVFGLREDPAANAGLARGTAGRVSADGSVVALVVPTDEELVIARDTAGLVS
jgi:acetate kinase